MVVEDNRADFVLLERAFEEEALSGFTLHVAINGDEALAFLNQDPPYADAPRPSIVLLDLNLPGKDGHEVLEAIKTSEKLRRLPVIVLTSSRSDLDVRQCYDLHANAYMTKASDFEELLKLVRQITTYWSSAVWLSPD